jgi:hypothetical protein
MLSEHGVASLDDSKHELAAYKHRLVNLIGDNEVSRVSAVRGVQEGLCAMITGPRQVIWR